MNALDNFNLWKQHSFFDTKTKEELQALNEETDIEEIKDRFSKELEFDKYGICGLMGAGTNRVNIYTISKIAAGFAVFLLKNYGISICHRDGVVIGYDTRANSKMFSLIAARVLSGLGVRVYLQNRVSSSSEVSFAIRHLNTIGGIMFTAGHNSSKYNGLRFYNENGFLLDDNDIIDLKETISEIGFYDEIDYSGDASILQEIDFSTAFISTILKTSKCDINRVKANLKIMFTPLHGSGYYSIMKTLERDGFIYLGIVEEGVNFNVNFPECFSGNIQKNELDVAINSAETKMSDIVIGSNLDAGRLGVAVRHNGKYIKLTGNQIGILLFDFILSNSNISEIEKPAVVKSLYATNLINEMAKKHRITVFETPKGFKFISEKVLQFQRAKKQGIENRSFDFLFGFEETFGYLTGNYIKDKDSIGASMYICEYASILKYYGKTLIDRLDEIYNEFGYYYDYQEDFKFEEDSIEKVNEKMEILRLSIAPFFNTKKIIDYKNPIDIGYDFGELPKIDMLRFELEDNSSVMVEPSDSGKELKVYYNVRGRNEREAKMIQQKLHLMLETKLEI